jgi:hypothetical protein
MLVVVGGHSRNIGKTSVVAGLIRRLRDRRWTAVKITQYGRSECRHGGGACGCQPDNPEHAFALSEEYEPGPSDSGRYLAAGAERSFWLRTPAGELARAAGTLEKIVTRSANTIIESNSVLELLAPDVFLMVVDFSCRDFKPSSLRYLDRADAIVVVDRGAADPVWEQVARSFWREKTEFEVTPPNYVSAGLVAFVKGKLVDASR